MLPTLASRHRCDISSKEAVCQGIMTRRWAPQTRYTLRRITANIMKDFIWIPYESNYVQPSFSCVRKNVIGYKNLSYSTSTFDCASHKLFILSLSHGKIYLYILNIQSGRNFLILQANKKKQEDHGSKSISCDSEKISRYTRYIVPKHVTSLRGPISALLRPNNTSPFEVMYLQRWQAVDNTVFDLTGPRFKPQTSRSSDERVAARPTGLAIVNRLCKLTVITA